MSVALSLLFVRDDIIIHLLRKYRSVFLPVRLWLCRSVLSSIREVHKTKSSSASFRPLLYAFVSVTLILCVCQCDCASVSVIVILCVCQCDCDSVRLSVTVIL